MAIMLGKSCNNNSIMNQFKGNMINHPSIQHGTSTQASTMESYEAALSYYTGVVAGNTRYHSPVEIILSKSIGRIFCIVQYCVIPQWCTSTLPAHHDGLNIKIAPTMGDQCQG